MSRIKSQSLEAQSALVLKSENARSIHRARNALAIIRSVARRSAENYDSVEEYAAHLDGRIATLARLYNMLGWSANQSVDLEEFILEEVISQLGSNSRFHTDGPAVSLKGRTAEVLGLAIHELTTNALKYGAFSTDEGEINVTWSCSAEGVILEWRERSAAPLTKQGPNGMGMDLILRSLPYDLDATTDVSFDSQGLNCRISLPMPAIEDA